MSDWAVVAGTLGGAAIGFAGGLWQDRVRWRRTDSARWLTDQRQLYARLVAAADALRNASVAVLEEHDWEAVRVAYGEVVAAATEVDLIGGDQEREAVVKVLETSNALLAATRNRTKDDEAARRYATAFGAFSDAQVAFVRAARARLVTTGR